MNDLGHLHALREAELQLVIPWLPPGCRLLEIGGGTGHQARRLIELGFDVVSIDLPSSEYAGARVHPIIEYDGRVVPLADRAVDAVFSSNVLEHVRDLPGLLAETRRVLRPGGICVHLMPTPAWRAWTSATHYPPWLLSGLLAARASIRRATVEGTAPLARQIPASVWRALATWGRQVVSPVHGERGNALTEVVWFHRLVWRSFFEQSGFEVLQDMPTGLFYTGYSIAGSRLPIAAREAMSSVFGSACRLYIVRPR